MAAKVGSRAPRTKNKPALTVVDGGGDASVQAKVPAAGREVTTSHNAPKPDKHAAEQAQLISYMSKLGEQKREVDKRRAILKEAQDEMTETFRLAKAAGFERQELNALLKDVGTRSKDLVQAEIRRRRHREWLGLPVGEEQLSMFGEATPSEARDEMLWFAEGYACVMRGDDLTAPSEMAPRFLQKFLEGGHAAQTVIASSMAMAADLAKNGGGANANANDPNGLADDSRPAGYKVEKEGDAWVTIDPKEEQFGGPHATEEAAWRACRNDAETIARQQEAARKAQAVEDEARANAERAEMDAEEALTAPAEPDEV